MKFHKATLSLLSSSFFLTSNLFCTSVAASASTALRGVGDAADADVDVVLAEEKRGVFLVAETEYEDGHDSQTFNIMIDDIIYELDDVEYHLDLETATKGLKSGQAIIIPPGVALEASSGKAKLNGAKIQPDENGDGEEQEKGLSLSGRDLTGEQQHNVDQLHRHLNSKTFGNKTVVAVRVKALDGEYSWTEDYLRREVFGLNPDGSVGDTFNLSSGYEQCSYGELTFSPKNHGSLINEGVVTIELEVDVVGKSNDFIEGTVTLALKNLLGASDLTDIADHWMYCLPPGTIDDGGSYDDLWKSYSSPNQYISVYNNGDCNYPSAQMHSIGGNLNFALSKEGEDIDESGMMGRRNSHLQDEGHDLILDHDEGPIMCFNAAKSWQSGWYGPNGAHGDKTMEITSADGCLGIETPLSGISDYDTTSNPVLIKVVNPANNGADIFVAFNARKGINSGTREAADQVTVVHVQGGGGTNYAESNLLAKLNAGESYTIGALKVEVDSITGSDVANVKIYFFGGVCEPATPPPSKAPTSPYTKTFGNKKVVAVRVKALDGEYSWTEDYLRREVFGLNPDGSVGDTFNLSSGYEQCSYGELTFSPKNHGSLINEGVVTIELELDVVGTNQHDVANEVTSALKNLLGTSDLTDIADYWMYCLPPGTIIYDGPYGDRWGKLSFRNYYLSVYNNKFCNYPSYQMNSLGYSLNFSHSHSSSNVGGFDSGIMGFFQSELDEGPVKCFNAAKSWQSGWYGPNGAHGDKTMEITLADDCLETPLSGIADYDTTSNPVLIKVVNPIDNGNEYFLAFNARKGINIDTEDAVDQVTVVQVQGGVDTIYPEDSILLAKLSADESFTIGDLTVEVDSITGSDVANVKICPTASDAPSLTPTTSNLPSSFPTSFPTSYPSIVPTNRPSQNPTLVQTQAPSSTPTTGSPSTQSPTPLPTYERNGPQSASYDALLGAPKCSFGSSCDSEGLLDGRGTMRGGNEPNEPNTLNNQYSDGIRGTYHDDESIDRIVVSQLPGILDDMTEGDIVTITANIWCFENGTSDYIDFYYASDASNPVWNQIGQRQQCPGGGAQIVTAEYILPEGSMQAVRVNLMYNSNQASAASCNTNEFGDTDDLIISVRTIASTAPSLSSSSAPSVQLTASPSKSKNPTASPTSISPTNEPSSSMSSSPSTSLSSRPSMAPITSSPTTSPSSSPSMKPSSSPSTSSSSRPSVAPITLSPTHASSSTPSLQHSSSPSTSSSSRPSVAPITSSPTTSPSSSPSSSPSQQHSSYPSTSSSSKPSMAPITSSPTTSPSSSPSQQSSSSPSLSPSTKPMKTLVCGKGVTSRRPCPEGLETTAAIDTKHEVRCCRDCGGLACSEPWKSKCPSYDPNLFALSEDDGVCLTGTFYEAVDFCRLIPGDNTRLCTPDELKNGCAKFTGCNFNKDLIWSCAYNGHSCSTDAECCGTCNASGICEGSY